MARTTPTDTRLYELVAANLRAPSGWWLEDTTGQHEFEFDPPLDTTETALLVTVRALAKSGLNVPVADYATVRTNLQILRDLRQLGRNPFMALTAADRDRMLYDALVADTVIWLAVLRE